MARYPYRGKLLLNRQGKKNTKYNVALCDRDEEVEFLQVEGAAQMLSGIVGEYDAKHLSRIESEIKAAGGGNIIKYRVCDLTPLWQSTMIQLKLTISLLMWRGGGGA
nr:hypothetical protein [uncultured Helicobacter sp.]